MNALIIEDEQLAADRLATLISEIDEDIKVVEQFDTVRDTVSFLQTKQSEVDILFCDVQLADGLSFNIFEKVDVHVPIVFTTAYDEYSLRAFKVNSVDYLLKPVQYEELENALKKYNSVHAQPKVVLDPKMLKRYFQTGSRYKERFLAKSGNKYHNKSVDEVTYFSSENRIVYLHDNQTSKKFITDFTLDELMKDHLDPEKFFRISRQFIINIDAIEIIKPYFGQRLSLLLRSAQLDELIVSREKVPSFKQWFNS